MSNYLKSVMVLGLVMAFVLCAMGVYFQPASFRAGGVVAPSRTAFTTIDGNTASTTAPGFGGAYLVQGTSTLIADVRDVDSATLYGTYLASSTAPVLNIRFQFSDSVGCGSNAASTTWYEAAPYTASISGLTTAIATSTTFTIPVATSTSPGLNTTIGGFALPIPLLPAQCVRAQLFNNNNAGAPLSVWYGIATKRAGYNISN